MVESFKEGRDGRRTISMIALVLAPILAMALVVVMLSVLKPRKRKAVSDPFGVRTIALVLGPNFEAEHEPSIRGEALAREVTTRISKQEITVAQINQADYGWLAEASTGGHHYDLRFGAREDGEWIVSVDERASRADQIRRTEQPVIDAPELRKLLSAINLALKSIEGVKRVSWHARERWRVGDEAPDSLTPC